MVRIKFVAEKRAISPIISIILLLMMTVAVAAGAYTWFMVNQQKIQATTETQVAAVQRGMAVNLRIIELNSTRTGVIVQNMGDEAVDSARIVVNNVVVNATFDPIPAGEFGLIPIGDIGNSTQVEVALIGAVFGSATKIFTITDNYEIEILNATCSPCTLGSGPGYCTVTIDDITYCSNVTGSCAYASQTNLTKLEANNTNNCI